MLAGGALGKPEYDIRKELGLGAARVGIGADAKPSAFLATKAGSQGRVRLPNAEMLLHTLHWSTVSPRKKASWPAISGSLIAKIPDDLTPTEIDTIKKVSVARGMSKDAVAYAIGFAEKENDWGRGGKQCIYFGGKLIVYVDNSGKVEDGQSFD